MEQTVIMADGTILYGTAGEASGVLWLYLKRIGFQDAANVAFDESKTQEIKAVYGKQMDVYTGFTVPKILIDDDDDREIKIQLTGTDTTIRKGLPAEEVL